MDLPIKNLDNPDENLTAEKLRVDVVKLGSAGVLARSTYEPGFHYSEHATPYKQDEYEDIPDHITIALAGRLRSLLPDGTEQEVGPGDVRLVPGWHGAARDAWVVGDEPFVAVSFLPAPTT